MDFLPNISASAVTTFASYSLKLFDVPVPNGTRCIAIIHCVSRNAARTHWYIATYRIVADSNDGAGTGIVTPTGEEPLGSITKIGAGMDDFELQVSGENEFMSIAISAKTDADEGEFQTAVNIQYAYI